MADVTIFVKGTAPHLYVFNTDGTVPSADYTGWPGKQMDQSTTSSDGTTWYYVNFEGLNSCSIIFNNGSGGDSNQTWNITNVNGTQYYYSNGSNYYLNLTPVMGKTSFAFFENTNNWNGTIRAYCWNGTYSNSWPGEAMTFVGGTNGGRSVYAWSTTQGTPGMIVFTNKNDGSYQTGDLTFVNGRYYYSNGTGTNDNYTNLTNSNAIPTLPVAPQPDTYVVAGPAAMFGDNWNGTSTANTMTEGNDGKYRLTLYNLTLTASTSYEYKVVKNGTEWIPNTVDNASFSVALNGAYDVTFIYDPYTGVYNVECTLQTATGGETYTVAGSNTVILGSSWDPTDSNNDMSLVSGVYQLTFNDVVLSDNNPSCEFRIAVNHSWVTAYPSGNANVSGFDGSGTYDIVFTYNPTTHDVTGVATKHAVIVNYYVLGDEALGLSWTPTPTTTMTYDDATGLYTYTYYVNNSGTHRFIFANGQATGYSSEQINEAWDYFNSHYRIGPINGDQTVTLNANMAPTQMAHGDHGAYAVTVGVGTYTIYYDPNNMTFRVAGAEPIYITGDLGLGLGWNYAPTTAMAYDDNTGLYSYTYKVPKQGTYNFVFANGQAHADNDDAAWSYFNSNYRIGPNVNAEEYIVGSDDWKSTQMAGGDHGAYSVRLAAGNVTIYFDKAQMKFKIESNGELGEDLYMVGGLTLDDAIHYYAPNDGVLMKYDNTKKLYYLNHVTLNTNATFCFSRSLGSNSEDWDGMGTRYGNADTDENYFVPKEGDATAHIRVTGDKINVNMPLGVWDENKGEWHMYTAGIYNVVVNIEDGWVKLIRTDQFSLFPMNVYLQKTSNVQIDNIGAVGHTYSADDDGTNPWPLIAWNRLEGDWNPSSDANHYAVTFKGDTTTSDGKQWWHWEVSASIAEVVFTRTNQAPYQSETIARKAGVLWYTWEEDNTMTAHSRDYFTSSAQALPGNVEVEEGHYYVYFINTVGWETVNCVAWSSQANPYIDGHGLDVQTWPGQTMTCIGVDPMTGYEVWEYDFGAIDDSKAPEDLLFHDGTPIATTDAKEQTGDFDFINGGVYDYLGLFDDAYTLNSLIRTARKHIRYTISNDLLGVYYDPDAKTKVTYESSNGTPVTEEVEGALYAKDLNDYGEKSVMPEGEEFTDYVYDICGTWGTDETRPSQIMDKREEYDQSNWIKLVVSPNYDGGTPMPVAKPDLRQYVNRIIPGGKLQLYMTDSINPTARVMAIQMGGEMTYEPNVYISENFNDTVVFNYTHREWQPAPYNGSYRTRPHITWKQNGTGGNIYAEITRERVEDKIYKMFYVAPKPQEIAYITWVVYDNNNEPNSQGIPPYGNYQSGVYIPYTPAGRFLPSDPGNFYSPMNWDRSETISLDYLQDLVVKGIITQAQLDSIRTDCYLSDNQLQTIWGGYGQQYGPFSNAYMQYGGIKVNWSLFDMENSNDEEWWQIFRPGQAYKFKAIIRYARGSEGEDSANNYYFEPSNGEGGNGVDDVINHDAPRRASAGDDTYYPNIHFTKDYKGLDASKFIIFPIEARSGVSNGTGMGNVTSVKEIIQDVTAPRSITAVRYYNLMGVESDKPFDGINIVVTTYSDGSRTSKKVLR